MSSKSFAMTSSKTNPIAVGGVGGSGTRVVASFFEMLGFNMGSDVNESLDNLTFTLLFKRPALLPIERNQSEIRACIGYFIQAMTCDNGWDDDQKIHLNNIAAESRGLQNDEKLALRLLNILTPSPKHAELAWGWKEPNTHLFLSTLLEEIPSLRYVHVLRNGLDMAYNANLAQLRLWGKWLLNDGSNQETPERAFKFWCEANRRVLALAERFPEQIFFCNYDRMLMQPSLEVSSLLQSLSLNCETDTIKAMCLGLKVPSSLGVHRAHPEFPVSEKDQALLLQLGY